MASTPFSLEERRRRRDQRLAVEQANAIVQQAASEHRAVTLEWAAVAVLFAIGLASIAGVWYRHLDLPYVGAAAWAGVVLGGLLANALLQSGRARLTSLALSLFVGIPLVAIPLRLYTPPRTAWLLFGIAFSGAAVFGAALAWGVGLRSTLGTLRENLSASGEALRKAGTAVGIWLHDAVIKWIGALVLAGVGAGLIYVGRLQGRTLFVWIGLVLMFLIGAVGLWLPGLYRRTSPAMALRHCGQLCFWLSLLAVPFLELGPGGSLPLLTRPSARFVAMGLGLVVIGATWFLQRTSIFSHHSRPEPKGGLERLVSLLLVLGGLGLTLGGAEAYQRMIVRVDQSSLAQTSITGAVRFQPVDKIRALQIVQPLERVPLYLEYVQFDDGSSYQIIPLLYPGEQLNPDNSSLVKALRTAASLNNQSFPESRVELWSR